MFPVRVGWCSLLVLLVAAASAFANPEHSRPTHSSRLPNHSNLVAPASHHETTNRPPGDHGATNRSSGESAGTQDHTAKGGHSSNHGEEGHSGPGACGPHPSERVHLRDTPHSAGSSRDNVDIRIARNLGDLKERRRTDPQKLHVLSTSEDDRGRASLERQVSRVMVASHALPTTMSEAERIHGRAQAATVPVGPINQFVRDLNAKAGPSSRGDLVKVLRDQPSGTAAIIPGHVVNDHLVLASGDRLSIQDLSAVNPQVVTMFVGCNTARVRVTGSAVVGTSRRIGYREAMVSVKQLNEWLSRRPLKEVLLMMQRNGLLVALIGSAIVLLPLDGE